MPDFRASLPIALTIPAAGILIATYLYNRPLPLPKERKISVTEELSHSFASGPSPKSLGIVNPRNHIQLTDSRSINLLRSEISRSHLRDGDAMVSDEEILARFLVGFFGGWSFTPERGLLAALRRMGKKFIEAKYTEMPSSGHPIDTLGGFSKTKLPPKGTILFGGNFMVLDTRVFFPPGSPSSASSLATREVPSYIDIGFGDPVISYVDVAFGADQKNFSGLHRFEIQYHPTKKEGEELTVWYSSLSCNPSLNRAPFPKWTVAFHRWYAMCLFRDGIEGVIRG
ncbi:uncharacterized protein LY89DRAFT_507637 [Mollisia scopiformis]|uniref:Uncharacterized protein n=1 Tax=Mollisia scopiformis TaxID=149040 RepID=A0A194XFG6_MOLSC|nr:uncharacterized protein LY89DRAFT_507637 [Mollisia scopiformis]KUJ18913.1 hypothetical protein LY89DRAFT_507637 [Mollisia scopiformis]